MANDARTGFQVNKKIVGAIRNDSAPTTTDEEAVALRVNSDSELFVSIGSAPGIIQVEGTADQDEAVSDSPVQIALESADFDGAALPNTVDAEGDVVRPKASLSGVPYSMLVNEDGSATPLAPEGTAAGEGLQISLDDGTDSVFAQSDTSGHLKVVGPLADNEADTDLNPVKMGAVADDSVSSVDDGDLVHLVTDLNRRLRASVDNLVTNDLTHVAGNAVETAASGVQAIGGSVASGGTALDQPVEIGGVDSGGSLRSLSVDTSGRPFVSLDQISEQDVTSGGVNGVLPVTGDVADDAASSASYPVKVGAIADEVVSTVADDDQVHLVTDLYRRLRIVSASYDSTTESDKVSVQNTIASDRDETAQTIADESDASDPSYYPSSSGLELGNRDKLNFVCSLEDGALSFEVSNDSSTWVDVTKTMVDDAEGSSGYDNTHYTSAAGTTTDFAISAFGLGYRYLRLKWEPADGTSTIEATLTSRAN